MSYKHWEINEMTDAELAYIAGIIDADGCIGISRKSCNSNPDIYAVRVIVTNSNMEVLEWLKLKVGAGCLYEAKTNPCRPDQDWKKWNKVHRWQVTNNKAKTLLSRILKFMIVKKYRAEIALSLPHRHEYKGNSRPIEVIEKQKEIFEHMKALNHRGLILN